MTLVQQRNYDKGWSAALQGNQVDDCKLIKHNNRADWLQGFNDATEKMEEPANPLMDQQKVSNAKNISNLMNFLEDM